MAYTPQTWTNGVSKLNATRMGHIETGIADIHNLVDAKGDLYTATAADTPARLAVGTNDKVLTADSAQSTGLKYSFVTNSMVDAAAAIAYSKLNLTGSIVNADISASAAIALSKLSGSYTAYTPTWTASGTAPAKGNGTITGRYLQIGKLIHVTIAFAAGSTTTFGTGTWSFTLPVTASSTINTGTAIAFDLSATAIYGAFTRWATTTTLNFYTPAQPGGVYGPTIPFTWANGDTFTCDLVYEAA